MTPSRNRFAREDGATAVLVAILLVALVGIAAFAMDFGIAYNNAQDLQGSADAAALGAAQVYSDESGSCSTLAANGVLRSEANSVAAAIMAENHPPAVGSGTIQVACSAGGDRLDVRWTNDAATDTTFGGVFGIASLPVERTAVATVGVAGTATGMRPFAVCAAAIPAGLPSSLILVDYDAFHSTGECPEGRTSGNWWTVDCPSHPDESGGGTAILEDRIREGCQAEVRVVPGQAPYYGSPGDLSAHLLAACPPDVDCLGTDTGNIRSGGVRSAWEDTLGKDIVLPVICGSVNPSGPICVPDGVVDAGGNNTEYPIHKFVGARVCGFQFGNSGTFRSTSTADCAGASSMATGMNNQNYMIFRFDYVLTSGSFSPDCSLGSAACDGARTVALTE